MAMEIYALSDRRLTSMAEWQRAIDVERFPFPLTLSVSTPFAQLHGFLPVRYEKAQTGFECDHWDPQSVIAEYPDISFGRRWKFALAFRFGGRPGELESAWMAAAAYTRATRGVVFDTEEGRIFEPNDAAQLIRKIESNRPLRAAMDEAIKRKLFPHKQS
jgi:hypothetical protein